MPTKPVIRFIVSKALLLLSALVNVSGIQAQPTPNDPDPTRWITYAQTYVKLPIAQTGLYRITTAELQQAGVSTHRIDPTTLQLFHRGVEQAIYVAGEDDRQLDEPDFIEFYGRANDGAQDSLLYRPTSAQPHAYYSLFSDTTAYFLTWRLDGQPGRRMVTYTDTDYANLTAETYHWEEDLRLLTDNYPGWAAGIPPWLETSYYDAGEGYTGLVQAKNKPYTTLFSLTNSVREGPAPQLDVLLVGRDFTNHRIACLLGPTLNTQRQLDSIRFTFYNNARIQTSAAWSDVGTNGTLLLSTLSKGEAGATDAYSISSIRLRYPQRLTVGGQYTRVFRLAPNPTRRSLIDLPDALPNTHFWDITDPTAPQQIGIASWSANRVRLVIRGTHTARTVLSVSQPRSVPAIHPVTFTDWTSRKPTYLIISHEALMHPVRAPMVDGSMVGAPSAGDTTSTGPVNAVREYARYRASAAGGGHDTLVVTMQQLIDQYSYGERHPLAIRQFADQLLRQSGRALQYLLLIGRSRSTPGIRHDPNQAALDLVMTAGFPGSDAVFTAGLNGEAGDLPALPTGRINAGSPQEVMQYLAKVKVYERQTDVLWRKQLLHLSGGTTPTERTQFRQITDTYRQQIDSSALGAQVTTYAKVTDQPTETINLAKAINEGVGLITFFGHSGLDVTDLDIGFCSNDALGYRNKGKYPLLLINGCAIGNFYYGRPTLATDWVLTPDRGAIAAIAQSHLGYPDVMHQYSSIFYSLLADSTQLDKPIGQLQQEIVRRLLAQGIDGRTLANCQQMVLQGDPAIRIFPLKTPDYRLTASGLTIQDVNEQPLTTLSDSVQIRAIVQNAGQYRARPLPVQIRRSINGREPIVYNQLLSKSVAYSDTLTLSLPNEPDAEGDNQFEVTINPADSPLAHTETNHDNNQAAISLTLADQPDVLPPLLEVAFDGARIADGSVVSAQPVIDVLVVDENRSLIRRDTTGLDLFLQSPGSGTQFKRLNWWNATVEPTSAANAFRIRYTSPKLAEGDYHLLVTARDAVGNRAVPYQVGFRVINQHSLTNLTVYPNPFRDQARFSFMLTGDQPPAPISIILTDLQGHVLRQLNEPLRIGLNEWTWDGRSDTGASLPAGVYLYSITLTDPNGWAVDTSASGRILVTR